MEERTESESCKIYGDKKNVDVNSPYDLKNTVKEEPSSINMTSLREFISSSHHTFKPEYDRYHLYVAYGCPWSNRCIAVLKLKGLEQCVKYTVVHPVFQLTKPMNKADKHYGWIFYDSKTNVPLTSPKGFGSFLADGCELDPINKAYSIRELYEKSNHESLNKKFCVPILWDKKTSTIVNNESADIIRMLNSEFSTWASGSYAQYDLYPTALRPEIDATHEWVYHNIIDGVYQCGLAKTQSSYDEAFDRLYEALERVESNLNHTRYIIGNCITELDVKLFMTLVRFDEVYSIYFKCNGKRMVDYPNIRNYMRDIYQIPAFGSSIKMDHIKMTYFSCTPIMNPFAILPKGSNVLEDLKLPHNRNEIHH